MSRNEIAAEAGFSSPVTNTDEVLQSLVDLVNITQLPLGITLNTGGFLVSGTLVSGKDFFDGVAAEVSEATKTSEKASAALRSYFEQFGGAYRDLGEQDHDLPKYIHLVNARFFHNSGKPSPVNRGVWWRGRIECVSGFFLGNLSASSEPPQ